MEAANMTNISWLVAPEKGLAEFVKNAPMQDIVNSLYNAAYKMEHPVSAMAICPDVRYGKEALDERAFRTRCFMDEIPVVLQATFERAF
jgi:hypothetical protein